MSEQNNIHPGDICKIHFSNSMPGESGETLQVVYISRIYPNAEMWLIGAVYSEPSILQIKFMDLVRFKQEDIIVYKRTSSTEREDIIKAVTSRHPQWRMTSKHTDVYRDLLT